MKASELPAILVTGGAGYIGSHTCKALAAAGYLPVALDNLSLGHRSAVKWGPLVVADLLDRPAVEAAIQQYDVVGVIHFAASAYVGDSMRDPAAYYRNNLLTTLELLDAMRNCGIQAFIFSSSCSVYGSPVRLPIDEAHPLQPLSPYGQSKLDAENALRWYGLAYGIRWIALRYFNAAGADPAGEIGEDHDPETRLVPRAVLAALDRGPPLEILGTDYQTRDGTAIRDYVHVADLASAHVSALRALSRGVESQVLNLGTGRGFSVLEVMRSVEALSGRPVPHRLAPRRAGDPPEVVADASRALSILDWQPTHSALEEIIASALTWHSHRLGGREAIGRTAEAGVRVAARLAL
ncbi:MAG TPA: UDP-glucose 4-epimerase GalE [Steroidobacteraceae bacterium]|jgi:UDP-arabinose 4-epimerase|nr:UDP-glucose 4-epimerase GalE [Steroidobacteraceae bacterium]